MCLVGAASGLSTVVLNSLKLFRTPHPAVGSAPPENDELQIPYVSLQVENYIIITITS